MREHMTYEKYDTTESCFFWTLNNRWDVAQVKKAGLVPWLLNFSELSNLWCSFLLPFCLWWSPGCSAREDPQSLKREPLPAQMKGQLQSRVFPCLCDIQNHSLHRHHHFHIWEPQITCMLWKKIKIKIQNLGNLTSQTQLLQMEGRDWAWDEAVGV